MKSPARTEKRFRVNPIELIVFSVVTTLFVHSIYQLLYDETGFHPDTLRPMSASPLSEGRKLASVQSTTSLATLDVPCSQPFHFETGAKKLRLRGTRCGHTASDSNSSKVKNGAQIKNMTTGMLAEVFIRQEDSRFSTDYISLQSGQNIIQIEFTYPDGSLEKRVVQVNYIPTAPLSPT